MAGRSSHGVTPGQPSPGRSATQAQSAATDAAELGVEVEIFHANIEGEVINRFYTAHDGDMAGSRTSAASFVVLSPALRSLVITWCCAACWRTLATAK